MSKNQEDIAQLLAKLELLLKKQQDFNIEVAQLRRDIDSLQNTEIQKTPINIPEEKVPVAASSEKIIGKTNEEQERVETVQNPKQIVSPVVKKPKSKSNLEKFIGENLINKIGILITVIGVFIGAKYSIENNLISPLTRIILGYLVGLGLVGFGMKLKAKYKNYSAVLVGGALAIMYFITYAGYSFYEIFPQIMAFALMVLFTVFGVVASLNYNKQIIAHIGLVGAYAVPFLLSNKSGNAMVLFGYITIINIGILAISVKKHWKALYYVAFAFTWLIYSTWAVFSYRSGEHFVLAITVISIFFVIFYATFLSYKFLKSEKFQVSDVFMLLLNSFIFYGLGYGLFSNHETGKEFLGLFTLANALIHFIVTTIIFKKKLADKNLFYLVAGLVLTFVTIAIPVQLDGNWVTLLWSLEAALLFWIGRSKNVPAYEYMSYPLMGLAFLSLIQDWGLVYGNYALGYGEIQMKPLLNTMFLGSVLFLVAFGIINWVNNKYRNNPNGEKQGFLPKVMSFIIPGIVLIVLYNAIFLEIEYYCSVLYQNSEISGQGSNGYNYSIYNYDLTDYKSVWLTIYTLFFVTVLIFVNNFKLKNRILGIITLTIALITGFAFLTLGLYGLSELRESYIDRAQNADYDITNFNIVIRYIAILFFAALVYAVRQLTVQPYMRTNLKIPFDILLHTAILWISSSELLHWMDILGSEQSYKLGISILWGVYSLLLIVLGIWKQKKYLRILAIILFAITLLKLFFYDIASLNTISKTIVFVSLGVLLLIISFLYNKYKHIITVEDEA